MISRQSARTLMLGAILLLSAVSAATGFVLAQYYSADVLSSLIFLPRDCWIDFRVNVGVHCFSDYSWALTYAMQPNPWEPYRTLAENDYLAAGMMPALFFGLLGGWLHAKVGWLAYLAVLTIAVFTPAVWAARGARGLERVVVFVACGAAAIPAWAVIDRGNSVGFLAPIGLVLLVALCRGQWRIVAVMVVLAALVKPQFAVLAVVLLAARQWRLCGVAGVGVVVSNLAAYLLWPRDFPDTIVHSLHSALSHGNPESTAPIDELWNVSFGKGLLLLPDYIAAFNAGGELPEGLLVSEGLRPWIGYVVLAVVVACVVALGRRIPPVMAGIALLAAASLFPDLSYHYYLVFTLPVAALVARDPDGPPGSGVFDRLGTPGNRRRALGVCVSLATAFSIAHIAVPGFAPPTMVPTTAVLAPCLWLITCAVIVVSYARSPAPQAPMSLGLVEPPEKHNGATDLMGEINKADEEMQGIAE